MTEPLLVDAGEHRITLKKTGFVAQAKPIALAGKDDVKLAFSLQPEPKAVATEKTVIVERKLTPIAEKTSNRGVYIALGWTGTALLAGSWVTTGLLGRSAANDRENAVSEKTTKSELDRLESKAFRYYVASDILAGASLLAAGGMLYYTIASPSDAKAKDHKASSLRRRIAVDFGPGSVAVAGQF
jgi:hypothetical protein